MYSHSTDVLTIVVMSEDRLSLFGSQFDEFDKNVFCLATDS
jgi:hypothetical protein